MLRRWVPYVKMMQQQQQHVFEAGHRTLYFSAGCVIENMRLAAANRGYQLKQSHFPDPSNPLFVATVWFERLDIRHPEAKPFATKKAESVQTNLAARFGGKDLKDSSPFRAQNDNINEYDDSVIEQRCTNRKFYNWNKKIEPSILSKLSEITLSENRFKLHWMTKENPSYSRLCRIIGAADQIRLENKRIHGEFMPAVRFSLEEADQTRDGLDIRTFEAGAAGFLTFKLITSWNRLRILNYFGMGLQFNIYAQLQMMSSQACGLLAAPNYEAENYLLGGEIMERIWHKITRTGLSMQPMESLPVFTIDLHLNDGQNFSETQRKKVETMKRELFSLYGVNQDHCPLFLFRMGYTSPPSARSLRRPMESFLTREPLKVQ